MKGIVLAGGKGTRLWPSTKVVSKQLLPLFDKPMIYYPLATLMAAGIREILIITSPDQNQLFKDLLGDGSQFGVHFQYAIQDNPNGLAEALIIGEKFLLGCKCALILGDNFFHGTGLGQNLKKFTSIDGAQIFAQTVNNPSEFGNIVLDKNQNIIKISEKPENPESNLAITGLYFYDESATERVREIKPSARNELEITSLNEHYLHESKLHVDVLPRGTTWMDTGTHDNINDVSNYVRIVEERQGVKIACLEEVSLRNGWLDANSLMASVMGDIKIWGENSYTKYILKIAAELLD